MSKTTFTLAATALAVSVLAGCSHTTTTREVVVTPEPVATTTPPTVIVANTPAPRAEVRPPAPAAGYVWQDGYWVSRNGQYEWVPGHWETARVGYTRTPNRWETEGQGSTLKGGPN